MPSVARLKAVSAWLSEDLLGGPKVLKFQLGDQLSLSGHGGRGPASRYPEWPEYRGRSGMLLPWP